MSNELTKKNKNELAAIDFAADAGAGLGEIARSEQIIPYIKLLQQMSPECQEGGEDAVDGAKPGMLFNTATRELIPGKEGVVIVPLLRQHVFVERKSLDDGGGVVARHEPTSDFVRSVRDANLRSENNYLLTPDGNQLVETFYLTALLLDDIDATDGEIVCISFSRTKIAAWKELINPIYRFQRQFPIYAHRIVLRSAAKKDKKGRPYYNFEPDFAIRAESGKLRDHVAASVIQSSELYTLAKDSVAFIERGLSDGTVRHAEEDEVESGGDSRTSDVPF